MRKELNKELKEWAVALMIGFLIFLVIRIFVFAPYRIDGDSMLPTLQNDNKVLVWKLFYNEQMMERFDVVVFKVSEEESYVKRIIGLPGDKVTYKDDQLFINDEAIEEHYLDEERKQTGYTKLTEDFSVQSIAHLERIPEGKVLVLGDNRLNSLDSRRFGLISTDDIIGEVKFRFWPFNEITYDFD